MSRKGDLPAVIETATGNSINYFDFSCGVRAVRKLLGNSPKTLVVTLPGGITDSVIWISALTGGHLLIPVSPRITDYELQKVFLYHKPDLLITDSLDRQFPEKLSIWQANTIEQAIQEGIRQKDALPVKERTSEGSVFLSSSGSTGTPKGMRLSAKKIVITAENIAESHRLTDKDRGLTPLPFHHVNAPIVTLITTILTGGTVIAAPKYSTTHFWEWVKKYDPTWISIVPTIVAMLLKTDKPDFLGKTSLRFIRTASAPLPVVYFERFEKKFGYPLIETYGVSEAGSTITANPVPPGVHKAGSVGLPIGVKLRICKVGKSKLTDVTEGSVGEICIKGENVIASYDNNLSEDAFRDGWFRTGDLGYQDTDGYVFITGRIKDIIIRGGESIAPREIEELLLTYPGVLETAVVGQADPLYGEKVAGFVVMQEDTRDKAGLEEKMKQFIQTKLSREKVPAAIHFLDSLPKGNTGKVDKQALKSYETPLA